MEAVAVVEEGLKRLCGTIHWPFECAALFDEGVKLAAVLAQPFQKGASWDPCSRILRQVFSFLRDSCCIGLLRLAR